MSTLTAKLQQSLKKRKLPFELIEHKTVFTAYDLAQTTKMKLQEIAKTLLVKVQGGQTLPDDPKATSGKRHILVVLPAHRRLDLAKVKRVLKAKTVGIASEKDMVKALKVKAGALTPFGSQHQLAVVMDKGLLKVTKALFGAGSFTESLRLKVKDYQKAEQPLAADIGMSSRLKKQKK